MLVAPAALVVAVDRGERDRADPRRRRHTAVWRRRRRSRPRRRPRRPPAPRRAASRRRLHKTAAASRALAAPPAMRPTRGAPRSRPRPASCSATRPSCACASTTSRRSRPPRSSAQQIALRHNGSVASLQYDAPAEGVGGAQITLRVPTARVQSAMSQLSQLGTIVGQRYGIEDLQVQADSLQTQIEQTQRRIAQILTQLESSTLSDENRVVLQSRLNASRQKLTGLREALRATNAEARTATIYLTPDDRGDPARGRRRQPPRRHQGRARLGRRSRCSTSSSSPARSSCSESWSGSPSASGAGRSRPGCSSRTSPRPWGARPARSCPGPARSRRVGGLPAPPPGRPALAGPTPCGVRTADAVVGDLDHEHAVVARELDPGPTRRRVLGDVRERLRDHVERGRLDRLGQPLGGRPSTSTGSDARVASASSAG